MASAALSEEEKAILDKALAMGEYLKKKGCNDFGIDRLVLTATIQQIYSESKAAFGMVSGLLGMFRGMGSMGPQNIVLDEEERPEDDETRRNKEK